MVSSLKTFLSTLDNPAPVEVDPEEAFHSLDAHHNGVLKKRDARVEEDDRYDGKKVNRQDLYSNDDEVESEGDVSKTAQDDARLEGQGDEELMALLDAGDEDEEEDEDEVMEGDEGEEDDVALSATQNDNDADAMKEDYDLDHMKKIKETAVADIEKGRAIRQQLALYQNLINLRIRMQKIISAAHSLPSTTEDLEGLENRDDALQSLAKLSQSMSNIRSAFMKHNSLQPNQDVTNLDETLAPYILSTMTKWSSQISATRLPTTATKLKALGQRDAVQSMQEVWSNEREKSRLLKRATNQDGDFDDTEFYNSLLRDSISTTAQSSHFIAYRSKRQRHGRDARASKGRKIRYVVHDKLVDFMVPQHGAGDDDEWTDARKDELFASLLGRGWSGGSGARDAAEMGELRLLA